MKPKNYKRPPLGLRPRDIAEYTYRQERIREIKRAMSRYTRANKQIPINWQVELKELRTSNVLDAMDLEVSRANVDKLIEIVSNDFPFEIKCPDCKTEYTLRVNSLIKYQLHPSLCQGVNKEALFAEGKVKDIQQEIGKYLSEETQKLFCSRYGSTVVEIEGKIHVAKFLGKRLRTPPTEKDYRCFANNLNLLTKKGIIKHGVVTPTFLLIDDGYYCIKTYVFTDLTEDEFVQKIDQLL